MLLDNFYCLTINDTRFNYLCDVFTKYGLPRPIKHIGFRNPEKSEQYCLFGHMSLILMARCLDLPYIFIFEDDAYPRKDVKEKLEFYIENRPKDCGILVLGRNGESGEIGEFGDYHIVYERPFGAHAYLVYKVAYTELLDSMERTRIADIALRGDNFKESNPYWINEYLFIQKNLDSNCMSKNLVSKYGKYFYPKCNGGLGVFSSLPPGNWE